ncbi:MAG: bifunctional metallophosphatase/5'-nucleotidase [Chloroflexi bacterium]|nr:bifunctional metallophosphatase/5'-nucleotidase [Chloroflexota bacterium]
MSAHAITPPSHLAGRPGWQPTNLNGWAVLLSPGMELTPPPPLPRPFRLKILHLNDLHGHIAYLTAAGHEPLFARIAGRLSHLRQRYANDPQTAVLFLSAGDDTAGSVFDELWSESGEPGGIHAGYRLYSAAGLDAAVLGNHDLDMGAARLAQAIQREAAFPLLSANLHAPPPLAQHVYAAAILCLKGVRVGLIGLTTPAHLNCAQVTITDPLAAARELVAVLRPFCHVLILLSHLGYSLESATAAVSGVGDVELARQLAPGSLDLIIGGHTHLPLNEQGLNRRHIVNEVPIVQAGALGRFLGEVTLTVQEKAMVTDARLTPTALLPVDDLFEATAVAPLLAHIRPFFQRRLGQVINHPDLSPEAVHNDFAAGESALANFITAGLMARAQAHNLPADFALIDASVVGDGLPVGDLTFADWFALMPYADTLRLCRLTGWQVWALLQDNARRLDMPREHHVERGFLHFSEQLRYTIYTGPQRGNNHADDSWLNGRPLLAQLEQVFTAVVPSFWRQLARSWEGFARSEGVPLVNPAGFAHQDTGLFLRRELVAYIAEMDGVNEMGGARRDGRLRILPASQPTEFWSIHAHRHVFHQPALP